MSDRPCDTEPPRDQMELFVGEVEISPGKTMAYSMEDFSQNVVVQSYWKAMHLLRSVIPAVYEQHLNDIESDTVSYSEFSKKVNNRYG